MLNLLEQIYTRSLSALWKVDPTPLFNRNYYLAMNPDLCRTGMDPLFHYLRFGAAEGRNPHPLFDTKYYLEQYPDVRRSGHNPLLHFLRFGGKEGRSPHPDFDSFFYLAQNRDVAAARINPLTHFVTQGAAEMRSPHPDFDLDFYLAGHPDLAVLQINPLLHFVEHGAEEGRELRRVSQKKNGPPEDFLPSRRLRATAPAGEIDVVIPVYKGAAETEACLRSVLSSRCATPFRVVVVNDCSPEPELTERLREAARAGRITLVENERNLGFVQSVNAGMQASGRDVVLLTYSQ